MMMKLFKSATVEDRIDVDGFNVWIMYEPPRGYIAVGKSPEIKNQISKTYFDTYDEAVEHAYLEIEGYLDDTVSEI